MWRASLGPALPAAACLLLAGCPDLGAEVGPDADVVDAAVDPGGLDAEPEVPAASFLVVMRNLQFLDVYGAKLAPLHVHAGDLLRFLNDEPTYVRHRVQDGTVTGGVISASTLFNSDYLDPGNVFIWRVMAPPGRFLFLCSTHPATMKDAEVWVE